MKREYDNGTGEVLTLKLCYSDSDHYRSSRFHSYQPIDVNIGWIDWR